jgi:hypothetical protein
MSGALGQVPVVCASAGGGTRQPSQDERNTKPEHTTSIDTANKARIRATAGSPPSQMMAFYTCEQWPSNAVSLEYCGCL